MAIQQNHTLHSAVHIQNADPLLNAREGASLLRISIPTWWRWVADGTIPKPVKLGSMSRWPQSDIFAVIEKAKAARTAA